MDPGFLVLALPALSALVLVLAFKPEWRRRVLELVRPVELWMAAAALAVVYIMLASVSPRWFVLVGLAVVVLVAVYAWVREFTFLMRLGDDAFPGRYDKLIWAFLLIALPPVGILAFWSYRLAHWPRGKPAVGRAADDLA